MWPTGQFFCWTILKILIVKGSSSSIPPRRLRRFRRRSTGCRWLSLSLLPAPRPPPLPAGGEAAPAPVPRTLRPRCLLRLLRRPPFRSLAPAAGSGAEGVREAEGEEVAEEDYGVCWSSLRTATERRSSIVMGITITKTIRCTKLHKVLRRKSQLWHMLVMESVNTLHTDCLHPASTKQP